jgi:hypothetical protein
MKYYIAYPGPIEYRIKDINSALNIEAIVSEDNCQVCFFESDRLFSDLEIAIEKMGDDLWLLNNDEKDEWIN